MSGSKTLVYDADGNLTSDGTRTFEWDPLNRLTAVTSGTHRSEFTYNGLSQRVKIVEKENGNVTSTKQLVWCPRDAQLCEERDGSNNVTKRFYPQGEQIGNSSYYYTKDHLGSIREMTDSSGVVQARYGYDPYGRTTKVSGSLDADFGFTGQYYHQPSGLHLALYRAYDPDLGRWISRDPLQNAEFVQGANLYGYVGNSPDNFVDSFGLARTLRDLISALVTAGVMTWQSYFGNPLEIKAPKTPTSCRVADDERIRKERATRPRKPCATARCISPLYDPFDDLDFVLDYDIDKSFDQNLREKYGPPVFLD